jgi:hypothetical protein
MTMTMLMSLSKPKDKLLFTQVAYKSDIKATIHYEPHAEATSLVLPVIMKILHNNVTTIELLAHHLPKAGTQSVTRIVARA